MFLYVLQEQMLDLRFANFFDSQDSTRLWIMQLPRLPFKQPIKSITDLHGVLHVVEAHEN